MCSFDHNGVRRNKILSEWRTEDYSNKALAVTDYNFIGNCSIPIFKAYIPQSFVNYISNV